MVRVDYGHGDRLRCPVWETRQKKRSTLTEQVRCMGFRGTEHEHWYRGIPFGGPRSVAIINETKEQR